MFWWWILVIFSIKEYQTCYKTRKFCKKVLLFVKKHSQNAWKLVLFCTIEVAKIGQLIKPTFEWVPRSKNSHSIGAKKYKPRGSFKDLPYLFMLWTWWLFLLVKLSIWCQNTSFLTRQQIFEKIILFPFIACRITWNFRIINSVSLEE